RLTAVAPRARDGSGSYAGEIADRATGRNDRDREHAERRNDGAAQLPRTLRLHGTCGSDGLDALRRHGPACPGHPIACPGRWMAGMKRATTIEKETSDSPLDPRDDLFGIRADAFLKRHRRCADVDEASDAFAFTEAQAFGDTRIVRRPFGQPVRDIAH